MAMSHGVSKLAISFLVTAEPEPIDSSDEDKQSSCGEHTVRAGTPLLSICPSPTSTVSAADSPRPIGNEAWRHSCSICSARFANGAKLLYHKISHGTAGRKVFACNECEIAFPKDCLLRNHMKCVHLKERPHSCNRCASSFFCKKDLVKHMATVHEGQRPYPCPECGKRFGMSQHVKRHLRTMHA